VTVTGGQASARCPGQPLSWLALERYHLGELADHDTRRIEAHLHECPVCSACLQQIAAGDAVVPRPLDLSAAPASRPGQRAAGEGRARRWGVPAWGWGAAGLGLAAAAATIVVFVLGPAAEAPLPPSRIAFKGGELAIVVVRERGGITTDQPTSFAPADRFKVLATCDPGRPLFGEVVVFQGGETSFPLAPARPLGCGNREPLPGAFRIDGPSAASICLVVGERIVDRARLGRGGKRALPPGDAACVTLEPVER